MGCDDCPRPERDIAYDETLKLVGQLTGVASYGRDLLKVYQQRGYELAKLRAELADERAAAVEAAKSYNASCSALVHERDALLAENADLRRLCADEHSLEGQAMEQRRCTCGARLLPPGITEVGHGGAWHRTEGTCHWVQGGMAGQPPPTFGGNCTKCGHTAGQHFKGCGRCVCGCASHEVATPSAESQPVQVRKAPPEIWWSPSKRSFYGLDAEGFMFRQACEPGHEMFTGLRSVPADAVALVPARPDPNSCTCRPIRGGLDVDKHCPNHGWTS